MSQNTEITANLIIKNLSYNYADNKCDERNLNNNITYNLIQLLMMKVQKLCSEISYLITHFEYN